MQGRATKPRISLLTVQIGAAVLTGVVSVVGVRSDWFLPIVPFAATAGLLVMFYVFFFRPPRIITMRWMEGRLSVDGYSRRPLVLRPTEVVLRRWVLPVMGTRHGDVLVLKGLTENQRETTLTFGVVGGQAASNAGAAVDATDIVMAADDFLELRNQIQANGGDETRDDGSRHRFLLVPMRGAKSALSGILPWFLAMAGVTVVGMVGEPLLQTSAGLAVVFGLSAVVLGAGLLFTFRRARRVQPEILLHITESSVTLGPEATPLLRLARGVLTQRFEIYVFSTRYGRVRIPVLILAQGPRHLRIGVWQEGAVAEANDAPTGSAPEYLVSASDCRSIINQLR